MTQQALVLAGYARFEGPCYNPAYDQNRLTGQLLRVYEALSMGLWFTLDEIACMTCDPQASVSAQIRHLRKKRFGSHIIEKRHRGDRSMGLWEYKLIS